jgi:TRAP-type C4-dicarboxylate transport system permease small subunit
MRPVVFSSKLTPSERRVYKAATILFIAVFFAFMWPIYPIFNRIRPLILGMPASLFYLVFLLAVAFVAILALYRWEDRHGKLEDPPDREYAPHPNGPLRGGEPRRFPGAAGPNEPQAGGN